MKCKIEVKPLGFLARFLDSLLVPIMYILSGTLKEKPQSTHFWNKRRLNISEKCRLDRKMMVHKDGIKGEKDRYLLGFIPIFYMPIFGGWRYYVVLSPVFPCKEWYVGWISEDGKVEISRIKLNGPVRVLIGPYPVHFFGIDAKDNSQTLIWQMDAEFINDTGRHGGLPLL